MLGVMIAPVVFGLRAPERDDPSISAPNIPGANLAVDPRIEENTGASMDAGDAPGAARYRDKDSWRGILREHLRMEF